MCTMSDKKFILISYTPTSLFSLRTSFSTNKGAKTLLCPSPYAIKCALINGRIRWAGLENIKDFVTRILPLKIAIKPPNIAIVQNTYTRILDSRDRLIFTSTIGFREFIFYEGDFTIAIDVKDWNQHEIDELKKSAAHVNYFGKKGSFFSYNNSWIQNSILDNLFSTPGVVSNSALKTGIIQMLDDFSPESGQDNKIWQRISPFDDEDLKKDQRISLPTFLPYRLVKTTRKYAYYRLEDS